MREIKDKLSEIVHELELKDKNCTEEIEKGPEGRLYLTKNGGKQHYYHATEDKDEGLRRLHRISIDKDSDTAKALAHRKFVEQMQIFLRKDISLMRTILMRMDSWDADTIMRALPRAYKDLPEGHFLYGTDGRQHGGWQRMDSGIMVPESLISAARQGILTGKQKEEIREIQREWAAQEYEVNTKNLEQRNKMTSRGLLTRSLSEVSIIERLYDWDLPFRYDQVIRIGTKEVSPDLSFLSITRGMICWEHCGMTHSDNYIDYHRYKRRLYESAGFVPWDNYIETYNERDGFLDIRMIDDIIEHKLLRWLHLD